MRRALPLLFALLVLAAGCGRALEVSPSPIPSEVASSIQPPSPATRSPGLATPSGVPQSFEGDLPPGEVPVDALVPARADVTGTWYASTEAGEAIVVAYRMPGRDPFRRAGGFVVWRRFAESPAWRPVFGIGRSKADAVLGTDVLTTDLTGDGSDDALVFEGTGGSGLCGRWQVVDLAAAISVYRRDLCDVRIDPSTDPVGLTLTESVYEEGDAHCCPSAVRTTVFTYEEPNRWAKVSQETTPL